MNSHPCQGRGTRRPVNVVVLLLMLLATACAPQVAPYRPFMATEGAITLYLQPLAQEAHPVTFHLAAIELLRQDGSRVSLLRDGLLLKGAELVGVQKRLVGAVLPPGQYVGLVVRVDAATLRGEEGETRLLVPQEELVVPQVFTVPPRGTKALFLTLDAERLLGAGYTFNPRFALVTPDRPLPNLKGFVTDTRANLVTVFNKKTMEVVDVISTGTGPKGAVLDQRQGWLYVAMAGADALGVIEVSTGRMLGRIKLNFGDEPGELALSADGRTLLAANAGTNTVSIIDTASLTETRRVRLTTEPTTVIMDVSAPRAYVLDALANNLIVLDLARGGVAATLALEETPVRGAMGPEGKSLYVITRFSTDLLIVDPYNLAVTGRIFVGSGSGSVKVDNVTGLIFLGQHSGEIAVVDPSSLITIDSFMTGGDPLFLAIDGEENSLFVVLPERGLIQKIDLVSKKILGSIEVDAESYAVAVMGER